MSDQDAFGADPDTTGWVELDPIEDASSPADVVAPEGSLVGDFDWWDAGSEMAYAQEGPETVVDDVLDAETTDAELHLTIGREWYPDEVGPEFGPSAVDGDVDVDVDRGALFGEQVLGEDVDQLGIASDDGTAWTDAMALGGGSGGDGTLLSGAFALAGALGIPSAEVSGPDVRGLLWDVLLRSDAPDLREVARAALLLFEERAP